ncbi:TPA: LPXTG cell wall anchor domain-containing protein [Streptococcus equi subsp. zooepidemicus]|nr:LPXTG cell wall anchor domain-containing protein [Streptococcus equi subsp. zooepidemicus]HEL1155804.1 LPXTG cell wall anchor domain-containing protein [Streptococcus equi subsp. zooepidemicus]
MARKHLNKYARRYGLTSAAIVLMAAAIGSGTSVQAQEIRDGIVRELQRYHKNNFPKTARLLRPNRVGIGNTYTTPSIKVYLDELDNFFDDYLGLLHRVLNIPGPRGETGPEGKQGSKGDQGEVGPQGPDSPQGEQGQESKPDMPAPKAPEQIPAPQAPSTATKMVSRSQKAAALPATGETSNPFFSLAALSIIASAGMLTLKEKKGR